MRRAGILSAYKLGKVEIPPALRNLNGSPWTIGYGETEGVHEDMWWTEEQADVGLQRRAGGVLVGVLRACPQLLLEPPTRQAACTSLAYNVGVKAFRLSSVSRCTARREYAAAADRFLLWNKAGGVVMAGLAARRRMERAMYLDA
jgi:lysozyme